MENENEKFNDRIKKKMEENMRTNMYVSEFDIIGIRDDKGLLLQCERCLLTFQSVDEAKKHLESEHKEQFIEQVKMVNGGSYSGEIDYQEIILDSADTMEESGFFQITTYPKEIKKEKFVPVKVDMVLVMRYKNVGKDSLSKYMMKLIDEGISEDDIFVKLNAVNNFRIEVRSISTTEGL